MSVREAATEVPKRPGELSVGFLVHVMEMCLEIFLRYENTTREERKGMQLVVSQYLCQSVCYKLAL
jgi:hypothetical protein